MRPKKLARLPRMLTWVLVVSKYRVFGSLRIPSALAFERFPYPGAGGPPLVARLGEFASLFTS
jgi:hypothetical protein